MDNDATTPTAEPNAEPPLLEQVFAHATDSMLDAVPNPSPDTAQVRAARDANAIAQVAAVVPVNPAEVMVAVQFVVSNAQGLACQRQAQDPATDNPTKYIHLAATMFRVSQGAARTLLRLQAARQQREATPALASSAALTEHCALQLMAKTVQRRATVRAEAERVAAERAEAAAAARALPPPPEPEPPPVTPADIAAAEAYAQSNPSNANRARIMRRKRGVPNWAMFTPPEPNVVNAIAFGCSPFLDALLPPRG